ncbi:MAG: GDYXXLXY domain-containing protein [Hoeflea sp.]|uniref:GDYXXLXY domain-containing protein n=1 Tax=Hoeflea sp. TaxID=1940281 RepID=UPI0032F032FD
MSTVLNRLRAPLNPVVAGVVCGLFLLGTLAVMIESRASVLRNGVEIVLKTEPIDPRDLMRGDYVRLGYGEGISVIKEDLVSGEWPEEDTVQPIWVVLSAGEDGLHEAREVHFSRPVEVEEGDVVMRSLPVRIRADRSDQRTNTINRTRFGIERYYVPEGQGLVIEQARNEGRTTVAVRVSEAGDAQIARLMIDGITLYEEPLY